MDRKIKIIFWVCLISIAFVDAVKAEEVFNESYLFSASASIISTTAQTTGAVSDGSNKDFGIRNINVNFDNIKVISELKFYSQFYIVGVGTGQNTINTTSIMEKYVSVMAYVDGNFYGSGMIGWQKEVYISTPVAFYYIVRFDTINSTYAKSLSGIKTMELMYDRNIYKLYVNPLGTNVHSDGTYTYAIMYINQSGNKGALISTLNRIEYDISDELIQSYSKDQNNSGYLNVTKYNGNFLVNISNITPYPTQFYSNISIYDISELLYDANGIYTTIQHVLSGEWVNRTIWSEYIPPMSCNDWDIYFNQSNYNLYDQMNITYDLMHLNSVCANFVTNNYQVQLINPDYGIEDQYLINSGDRFYYWLPVHSKVKKGIYTTYLNECWKNMTRCVVLAQDTAAYGFSYSNVSGNISTDKTIYYNNQSVNISYNLTGTNSGRIVIKDDNKSVIFQKDVVSGYDQHYNFSLVNYPIGIYNVFLQHYTDFWNNLDETTFYILSNVPEINIYRDNYIFGDTLEFIAYNPTSDGYINLFDSKNNLLSNYSINQYDLYYDIYYLKYSLPVGNYTIYMYNNTGIIAYDHTWVDASIPTATPTVVIPTPAFDPGNDCQPTDNTLIAIPEMISCITFGKVDKNSDQVYQDSEISTFGNKIFMTLALLIFIIILLGIFSSKRR